MKRDNWEPSLPGFTVHYLGPYRELNGTPDVPLKAEFRIRDILARIWIRVLDL